MVKVVNIVAASLSTASHGHCSAILEILYLLLAVVLRQTGRQQTSVRDLLPIAVE